MRISRILTEHKNWSEAALELLIKKKIIIKCGIMGCRKRRQRREAVDCGRSIALLQS